MLKYNLEGQSSEKSTSMKQGMKVAFATITRKSHNLSGSSSRPALWQNNAYSNLKPKFSFWFGVLVCCEVGKPEVSQRSWLGNRAMQSQQRQDLNTTSSSQQNFCISFNWGFCFHISNFAGSGSLLVNFYQFMKLKLCGSKSISTLDLSPNQLFSLKLYFSKRFPEEVFWTSISGQWNGGIVTPTPLFNSTPLFLLTKVNFWK